ncbi:MAG: sensor histidine kinase [Candidatus Heimdallarchaeaceae archaeon]
MLSEHVFSKKEMLNKNLIDLFNFADVGLYKISIKPKIKILFCNEVIKNFLGTHYDKIINEPLKIKNFLTKSSVQKIENILENKSDFNEIFVEWKINEESIILKHINRFIYNDTGELIEIFGMTINETDKIQLLNELKESETGLKTLNELSSIENKAANKEQYFQFMLDLLISRFKLNSGSVYKKAYNSEYVLVYEYNSKKHFNNFSLNHKSKKQKRADNLNFANKIQKGNFNEINKSFNITSSKFKFFVSIPIYFANYQYGLVLLVTNNKRSDLLKHFTAGEEFLKKVQSCISSAVMRYILSENLFLLNKKTTNINRELVEFNETISHDIKNGLSSIAGFLELYELKKNKNYLDKIHSKIEYLTKILEKNLELAKAGLSVKLKKVKHFEEIVKEVAEITIPQEIQYIQENFTIDLFCDEEKIRQVFTNIFNNAVKHGNPTKIVVEFIERKTDVLFIISNNGKSIPEENMELIFDHGFSTDGESTGIGLSIVKKILETHNGTITVESSPELTSFTISLPKQ